jgi:DNA-binding response OmpR family regulator
MSARIMVVEDEEALTTLLRYNLDAEGYDVETVARGDDAIADHHADGTRRGERAGARAGDRRR